MVRTRFVTYAAVAVLGACTLPAFATPRDYQPVDIKYTGPQGGYYQPDDGAAAAARRSQGVRLNIPFAQWSNDVEQPRGRNVRTDARTWYIPAPGVQRYASTGQQQNEYYYPQGAYQPEPQAYQPPEEPHGKSATLDYRFRRQLVDYDGNEKAGTVIIDTEKRFLFYVMGDGQAIRYGIGVGRPGFEWAGVKTVSRKAEWPDWTPPDEMLERRPDLPRFMPGGIENPLGARAMYLGSSLYRIHGTNEPTTIGKAVSSGCIRMVNDDVIDLYGRVRVGTRVIVI